MGCGNSKSYEAKKEAGAKSPAIDKQAATAENKEFQQTMAFLSKIPLFMRLPSEFFPILAQACEPATFKKGQVVIKQGDEGSEFFVIKKGEAVVQVQASADEPPTELTKLKDGDYFGEMALLRDEPRAATIIAKSNLSTLKIRRDRFRELELNELLSFANRKAVGGGNARVIETKPPDSKTPEERSLISSALRKNEALQTMLAIEHENRVNSMIDIAWKERVVAGTEIIKEGDLTADYFYVVQAGAFEVFVAENSDEDQPLSAEQALHKGESKKVSTIEAGGSFGELALLYLVPRAATVKAKVDSVVWVFDRDNFKDILMKASREKVEEYVQILQGVDILHSLLADERKMMAQALLEMHFAHGEIILQQGEAGTTFFILYEGEVSVVVDGREEKRLTASARRAGSSKFFGERALLKNEPRAATVTVTSTTAKALALDRDTFQQLLGPLEEIMARGAEGESKAGGSAVFGARAERSREQIFRKDLSRIGLLGCGGFGAVELYEHKVTKQCYAMKDISKGYIVKTGMQGSVMNEKNILLMTNSVFIIKLYETYNSQQKLHFLMEPALGGELHATYSRKGFYGSERHALFYAAGVVLGFEHLHERFIIYRDLKPENLLLNEKGQLKIADMGLAKFVIGKTFTSCGTPDYFAPEVIMSIGHTSAVDWWTLGILIFELLSGHPPFEAQYPDKIYGKVMSGINKVPFPPKCRGPVADLIKALLKKDPSERLPARSGGVKNLKEHKWFSNLDWVAFNNLEVEPPYQPHVKSKKDISNFSARKEDWPKTIDYVDDGSGWDKDFATSRG